VIIRAATLEDGWIRLRPWRRSDAPGLVKAMRDEELRRWVVAPLPYTRRDAEIWIASQEQRWTRGELAELAIAARENDELLGAISLGRFNWREWRAEVGYWLVPAARGRGVATQSVRMVARWAFEELGLVRLELLAHPDNVRSQAVAERSGFLREGRVRSYRRSPQGRSDMVLYSLLPGDMADAA
jgi:RimJ/RimL family protein N-acetyltransferase